MSRKMKLENKPYSKLIVEGYVILPPDTDISAYCQQKLEKAGYAVIPSDRFVPGTGLVVGDGNPLADLSLKVLEAVAKNPVIKPVGKASKASKPPKDKHPLADFSVDALNNKVTLDGKVYEGTTLRVAVEKALLSHTNLVVFQDVFNWIEATPPHENRTIILGILKPNDTAQGKPKAEAKP